MTHTVLVSGFGDDGRGGVFRLDGDEVEQIDAVPTTRLARLLRAPAETTSRCELVVYDASGATEYRRVDAVRDPHDVLAVDDGWLVVSTGTNEIVRVAADGSVHSVWKGVDPPDACHVNCVTEADGKLWASAFGWFDTFKGWRGTHAVGAGVLWNLETGEELGSLSHPHTPRFVDGDWLVCESIAHAIVRRDHKGVVMKECELGGYTRGLCRVDGRLLVGVSAKRKGEVTDAHVAVLDLDTFAVEDRIAVPCAEIYEVLSVPNTLVEGVRVGFATNAYRAALDARLERPVTGGRGQLGAALERSECGCRIVAILPTTVHAGEAWLVDVEVTNTGTAWLASVAPHPVYLASRWIGTDGQQVDGDRVPLPDVLPPGRSTRALLPLAAPTPGAYRLAISLVQERRLWFDEIDPDFATAVNIGVV
jgi:hypothetical protein